MKIAFRHGTRRYELAMAMAMLVLAGKAIAAAPAPTEVPNFHRVTATIYRGAAPTHQGLLSLKSLGVRTIVDLRISPKLVRAEKRDAERNGFAFVNIPMGKEAPTSRQVALFLSTLAGARSRPVFVHCQHGADRTGCMIGIYRVVVQRWPFAKAWAEMRRYGFKPYLSDLKQAVRSRATAVANGGLGLPTTPRPRR
jgi:protein tyrosine/serine phosphatase